MHAALYPTTLIWIWVGSVMSTQIPAAPVAQRTALLHAASTGKYEAVA